jgi:hypothetical protein
MINTNSYTHVYPDLHNGKGDQLCCHFVTANSNIKKPCVVYLHTETGNCNEGLVYTDQVM